MQISAVELAALNAKLKMLERREKRLSRPVAGSPDGAPLEEDDDEEEIPDIQEAIAESSVTHTPTREYVVIEKKDVVVGGTPTVEKKDPVEEKKKEEEHVEEDEEEFEEDESEEEEMPPPRKPRSKRRFQGYQFPSTQATATK